MVVTRVLLHSVCHHDRTLLQNIQSKLTGVFTTKLKLGGVVLLVLPRNYKFERKNIPHFVILLVGKSMHLARELESVGICDEVAA